MCRQSHKTKEVQIPTKPCMVVKKSPNHSNKSFVMHNYSNKMGNLESAHLYAPNLVKRDVGVKWQNNFHT